MTRRKRKFIWLVVIVLVLFAIGRAAGFFGSSGETGEVTEEVRPERGSIRVQVSTSGMVKPQNRLEVKPPISGRIEEILVEEGDSVKKGDVLAWMSSTTRALLLDAARLEDPEKAREWEDVYKPAPLVAPMSGTVIVRSAEPGQTVTSQDSPFVLADRLIVQAQVDETDIGQVKEGQRAVITLDAYPNKKVRAVVGAIAYESRVVNNVTTYEVDILPERVPEVFRSGMSANVDITVAEEEDVLLLPVEAVKQRKGKRHVLVKEGEKAEPISRTVEVGISDGKMIKIISGLNEEDVVLIIRRGSRGEGGGRRNPFFMFGRRRGRR